MVAGARNHRNRLASPSRWTSSGITELVSSSSEPRVPLTSMNGNQVGMGVGISWEFGNRVSPGRHRIRLAGMQRGRAQDFQTRTHPLPQRHDSSRSVVIRLLRLHRSSRWRRLKTDEIKSLGTSTVRVNPAMVPRGSGYVRRLTCPDRQRRSGYETDPGRDAIHTRARAIKMAGAYGSRA